MAEVEVTITVKVTDELGRPQTTFSKTARRDASGNPRFIASTAHALIAGVGVSIDQVMEQQHGKLS